MIYELNNPSDMLTFEAVDDRVAALVCTTFGSAFGVTRGDGGDVMPIALFGYDWQYLNERYGWADADALLADRDTRWAQIADALDSVMYVSPSDRRALVVAFDGVPDRLERMKRFNDEKRTSMSNLAGHAYENARRIRDFLAKKQAEVSDG
jgi:hypothetical protein